MSRRAIRSLSPDQLDALAKHARLLGTVVRDDKVAEGCMMYFNELVTLHNKAKREKYEEEAKSKRAAKKAEAAKAPTWNDRLIHEPQR